MPTAEEVLFVLNGCEPIDPASLWFCVITAPSRDGSWYPCQPGELLVVNDEYGREPIGGRKPAKWDLAEFYTQDFAAAKALSDLVQGKPKPRRGWWEWDGETWTRPDDQAAALERWRAEPGADSTRTLVGVSPGEMWPPMMGAK